MNNLVYAYMGDAVYEIMIRDYFIQMNTGKVNDLQKVVTKYVSAKGQVEMLSKIENNLTETEKEIILRGRNHKQIRHPKNTDIITYKKATGFEALLGYLYYEDKDRLKEIKEIIYNNL